MPVLGTGFLKIEFPEIILLYYDSFMNTHFR